MRGISLNPDKTSSQNLANGALSYTATYGKPYKLDEVIIDFSQAVTETVTVTVVSGNGTNYNQVIQLVTLVSETSFIFRPQGEANYHSGDKIKVECTNVNTVGIAYCTIKTSQLGSGGY